MVKLNRGSGVDKNVHLKVRIIHSQLGGSNLTHDATGNFKTSVNISEFSGLCETWLNTARFNQSHSLVV